MNNIEQLEIYVGKTHKTPTKKQKQNKKRQPFFIYSPRFPAAKNFNQVGLYILPIFGTNRE